MTEELGFTIELRGSIYAMVWPGEGCRPANDEEVAMWKALNTRAQIPGQGGEAVAWGLTYNGRVVAAETAKYDVIQGYEWVPLYTHPADQVADGVFVSRELHLRSLNMLSNYVSALAGIDFPDNDEGDYRQRINESERARVNRAIKELRALLAKSEGEKK